MSDPDPFDPSKWYQISDRRNYNGSPDSSAMLYCTHMIVCIPTPYDPRDLNASWQFVPVDLSTAHERDVILLRNDRSEPHLCAIRNRVKRPNFQITVSINPGEIDPSHMAPSMSDADMEDDAHFWQFEPRPISTGSLNAGETLWKITNFANGTDFTLSVHGSAGPMYLSSDVSPTDPTQLQAQQWIIRPVEGNIAATEVSCSVR